MKNEDVTLADALQMKAGTGEGMDCEGLRGAAHTIKTAIETWRWG